jgi:CLIP-associating protein 1/2
MGPPGAAAAPPISTSVPPATRSHTPVEPPPSRSATNLSASVSSFAGSERPVTPGLDGRTEPADPVFLNTSRELEDIFREMEGYFEGRETEHNWLRREESIGRLRGLIAGNAVIDYHDQFVQGLRALLDGILKTVNSLRTSLSKEGCSLVQDMAMNLGPSMDPMVELLMQSFVKLAASTKKIAASLANTTVDAIVARVTYTNRLMQHITFAMEDKNVQPRLFSAGWLTTLLRKETNHRGHLEHSGGVDLMEKSLKKAINDQNPGVREKMRAVYWVYAGIWPGRAEM